MPRNSKQRAKKDRPCGGGPFFAPRHWRRPGPFWYTGGRENTHPRPERGKPL
ncbi:hypothetical protein HMPREF0262_01916 [Clostridium sp. ATCC 29733]|nr:hypothetical protein HMPREF0262_01916 [Clostridium sp. ATCC 29733]